MSYCKICKHNFNSGETFARIGNSLICANCAFSTTVYDLVKRGIAESETLDENAIETTFVVADDSPLTPHPVII